ncbi:MAG: hypothetical protein E7551_08130 [Ruminococcaceae bacterium]|nr:hypothetical protein [Oscillospiraceae bacterium]
MRKAAAILLAFCFVITLCSCSKANDEKYKGLIEALENKDLPKAYAEYYAVTAQKRYEYHDKLEKEYKNKVTEIKIDKNNILDYFEIVDIENPQYNDFSEIEMVFIDAILRLKEGYTLADSTICPTEITINFTATEMIRLYELDTENGVFTLKDYISANDVFKTTFDSEETVTGKTTTLCSPRQWGSSSEGTDIHIVEDIEITKADGTLCLLSGEENTDSNDDDKYKLLLEALEKKDIYTAYNQFNLLTENARKKHALKMAEEYKKAAVAIEINTYNLLDYFEIVNLEDRRVNDFGETEMVFVKTSLRLKKEYTLANSDDAPTEITASFIATETSRIYYLDPKSGKFTLKGYAPYAKEMERERVFNDIVITERLTEIGTPTAAGHSSDYSFVRLYEDVQVANASGTLYLVNYEGLK